MTIAAGFDCSDGFVLCADTEVSFQSFKFAGAKIRACIESPETKVYLVCAGSTDSFDFVFSACQRRLSDGMTLDEAEAVIAEALSELHEDHLYKSPAYGGHLDPLNVQIIAALWVRGERRLLQSMAALLTPAYEGYALRGCGLELGRYLVERFVRPPSRVTIAKAALISVAMLMQVKRLVQGCGGNSLVMALTADGRFVLVKDIAKFEHALGLIEASQATLMLETLVGNQSAAIIAAELATQLLTRGTRDPAVANAVKALVRPEQGDDVIDAPQAVRDPQRPSLE